MHIVLQAGIDFLFCLFQQLEHTGMEIVRKMQLAGGLSRIEVGQVLHEERVFEERGKKFVLKDKCVPVGYMLGVPIAYFSRLGEEYVSGNGMAGLVVDGEHSLSFGYKSDVVVGQRMCVAVEKVFFDVFQFNHVYKKLASVLGFVEGVLRDGTFHDASSCLFG